MKEIKDEIRKLIVEERRLYREMERIYGQVVLLEKSINEVKNATVTLREIKMGKDVEGNMLFPIGGGIFVFGVLADRSKVLVNIGANVYLSKTVEDALKLLNENYNFLSKTRSDLLKILNQLRRRHDEIATKIMEYQASVGGR
ncbi:prefoldin subunit alpha [Candidatus Geothermarchaeota archaeon]|nr:MAG: prefoldin subunit alpha [Candidatus Geothermarchaeota archaeon]